MLVAVVVAAAEVLIVIVWRRVAHRPASSYLLSLDWTIIKFNPLFFPLSTIPPPLLTTASPVYPQRPMEALSSSGHHCVCTLNNSLESHPSRTWRVGEQDINFLDPVSHTRITKVTEVMNSCIIRRTRHKCTCIQTSPPALVLVLHARCRQMS
ncbi:hypothetical protein ElyMa_001944000 [Elysia marginata]|uniref:Secreted protein n=1 Tax=Elysia marginata TaxID=1093978 RepID=A0AAV4EWN8_9GAST|nr:hypothetical protein ElyMa_001944000 [Elysia marginata]